MKKRKFTIILGIVLLIIGLCLSYTQRGYRQKETQRTAETIMKTCPQYDIDANFDPEGKKVTAVQNVTIVNNYETEFNELYFHLYPNAFKTFDEIPFPRDEMQRAYPDDFAPGYISIKNMKIDASKVSYEIEGTILKVVLQESFKPKSRLILTMEFEAILPPSLGRYGYGDNTFNVTNWYPLLAVYDEDGWHKDPYYSLGDPFYSDVGIYDVSIKAPEEYTIAASGSLQQKQNESGQVICDFKTGLVRDFAWIASENFETKETRVGNTRITSYYLKGDETFGIKALEYAQNAIRFFDEYFYTYPYDEYSVVAADFYIGGMEYPNLVMIGVEFYDSGDFLEYVIVHETAHQWWYGLIGNNQIEEAWLDEALTEYSTALYYEHYYGRSVGKQVFEQTILNPYRLYETANTPGHILRHLSDFVDWKDYTATVYYKGAIMIKDLEGRMGKGKLQEAMRDYLNENLYKNATTDDFIESLNRASGVDWTEYIYDWLRSSEVLDKVA